MANKRKGKRKSRTEVSSPLSSDSEAAPYQQQYPNEDTIGFPQKASSAESAVERVEVASPDSHDDEPSDAEPVFTKRAVNSDAVFEDWYLQQATNEFANDLDKLRSASDFNGNSIPLLVGALKQGTACFSDQERAKIRNAVPTANLTGNRDCGVTRRTSNDKR